MKNQTSNRNVKSAALLISLAFSALAAGAQQYAMPWHQIGGGVTASAGGQFSVSGTIGQTIAGRAGTPDVVVPDQAGSQTATGNSATPVPARFTITSGFAAIVIQQTVGAPQLSFSSTGSNVAFTWTTTSVAGTLQQSTSLDGTWTDVDVAVTTSGSTRQVSIPMTAGVSQMFYRLRL